MPCVLRRRKPMPSCLALALSWIAVSGELSGSWLSTLTPGMTAPQWALSKWAEQQQKLRRWRKSCRSFGLLLLRLKLDSETTARDQGFVFLKMRVSERRDFLVRQWKASAWAACSILKLPSQSKWNQSVSSFGSLHPLTLLLSSTTTTEKPFFFLWIAPLLRML